MNVKFRVLSAGVLFFVGQGVVAQKAKQDTTSTKEIEEVVVVAYGKQKKNSVVGSNLQIKSEKIAERPISNVSQALDGAGPGIQVTASTGQPGEALSVRIRGISSYNYSNSPLYVLDGAIYNGPLSAINPSDIESINVLKDAAATSLYGSSAANGVVLLTTKVRTELIFLRLQGFLHVLFQSMTELMHLSITLWHGKHLEMDV